VLYFTDRNAAAVWTRTVVKGKIYGHRLYVQLV